MLTGFVVVLLAGLLTTALALRARKRTKEGPTRALVPHACSGCGKSLPWDLPDPCVMCVYEKEIKLPDPCVMCVYEKEIKNVSSAGLVGGDGEDDVEGR